MRKKTGESQIQWGWAFDLPLTDSRSRGDCGMALCDGANSLEPRLMIPAVAATAARSPERLENQCLPTHFASARPVEALIYS